MGRRMVIGICAVIILVIAIGFGYVWAWTKLEIVGSSSYLPQYQEDGYLEVIVLWQNTPSQAADYLASLIRIEGFAFHDASGQFLSNGELCGVVTQARSSTALKSVPGDDRTVVELLGKSLAKVGLFPEYGDGSGKFIFLYHGVSFTGNIASTEHTGPNTVELTYSVFGFKRKASWGK